ncbi:hypothetical protein RFI_19044 [Reticulomyxa filosa]|uniref:Uncharacterized protein n=1 Tax=Reticulomyxa filosa TaxID=46433 RepID=X6MWL1_RETFI|nr:hypothetical protein RFI_19044 [Reticulomyxa filosa]|eukprot:ETO18234.1 hypothetical protein RFI_19044 [Reticulomyxa filosa]
MIGNAIQQAGDLADHVAESTEQLKKICGLHDLVASEAQKGKGTIRVLLTRAFWDKYIYHVVFFIYMIVALYIVSKRVGNLFYRFYDWICWLLSWFLFWVPGFQYSFAIQKAKNNKKNYINELYMIKGNEKEYDGIYCLKFILLKKKDKTKNVKYDLNLCYGSYNGLVCIWG